MHPTAGDRATEPITNALTVDVEDWIQSVYDHARPMTDRFAANTERILELFAQRGVRGTFFILGLAAKHAPDLVRRIHAAGHEIGSHGFGHQLVHTLTPDEFRADLVRSKKTLEDIVQAPVICYRAPAFSISRSNFHALDVIAACGFTVDASICPARTRRYGVAGAPRSLHRIVTPSGATLVELPVTVGRLWGRSVPMGGGGFLRLFPAGWVGGAIRRLNASGVPGALYMHPYEFAPNELRELADAKHEGIRIPWRLRLHQGLGRRSFARKVDALLGSLRFGTIHRVIERYGPLPTFRYGADGRIEDHGVIRQAESAVTVTAPAPTRVDAQQSVKPRS